MSDVASTEQQHRRCRDSTFGRGCAGRGKITRMRPDSRPGRASRTRPFLSLFTTDQDGVVMRQERSLTRPAPGTTCRSAAALARGALGNLQWRWRSTAAAQRCWQNPARSRERRIDTHRHQYSIVDWVLAMAAGHRCLQHAHSATPAAPAAATWIWLHAP